MQAYPIYSNYESKVFPQVQSYVLNHQPNITFSFSNKKYLVKTANTKEELSEVLSLRNRVFNVQVDQKEQSIDQIDHFDQYADILIVKSKKTDEVVGSYRLILSQTTSNFYSQEEFSLSNFIENGSKKLELSRACIDPKYRNGILVCLLWKGLLDYARLAGSEYLFGCSSLWIDKDFNKAKELYLYLKKNGFTSDQFQIKPIESRKINNFKDLVCSTEDTSKAIMPALLRGYLRSGAKVHGEPAYDPEFNCIDFFTILKISDIDKQYKRKLAL